MFYCRELDIIMKQKLIILDIHRKIKITDNFKKILKESSQILSLTPYSIYIAEKSNNNYITFHDLISIDDFKKENLNLYSIILDRLKNFQKYFFMLMKIMTFIAHQRYINILISYCKKQKDIYEIIYITDTNNTQKYLNTFIDKLVYLNDKDIFFYKLNSYRASILSIMYNKNIIKKIINKFLKTYSNYDAIYYQYLFSNCEIKKKNKNYIDDFYQKLKAVLMENGLDDDLLLGECEKIIKDYIYEYENFNQTTCRTLNC